MLPADTYIVKNNTILNDEIRNVLFKLYEPIIGSTAISLYFTLWSDLDTLLIMSKEYNHHNLMAKMRLKLDDLLEAREKLEAIGLLKTYVKKGTVNNYIYELYSPLEPKEFIENPILSCSLENNIGKSEYKELIKYFTIPKINLKEYKDITSKFNETFDMTNLSETPDNIRKISHLDLVIDEKINLNGIIQNIPSEYLNHKTVTKQTKELVYKIAYVYNLNEEELEELIRNSIDEKHMIDKDKFRQNARNYYTFEHKGNLPSLIYKKQPEYLRKQVTDDSKKSKLIYTFENTSPYDYLAGKNKGVKPSKNDLNIVETLLIDYNLTPGVVNFS